jgi:anti-anti-sigma factor
MPSRVEPAREADSGSGAPDPGSATSETLHARRSAMALLEAPANISPSTRPSVATVIWLRGEHDVTTVPDLTRRLDRVLERDDADVVIDLSDVEFMDAATIGAIVRAREFLRLGSRSLSLRSPSTRAQRVLDLCEMSDLVASSVRAPSVAADANDGA